MVEPAFRSNSGACFGIIVNKNQPKILFMGRGNMFLPISILRRKLNRFEHQGKIAYARCKSRAAAIAIKYIADKINSADQQTIDRISDELIDMGESFYLALLHIKRLADSKYASRFFEKEKLYIFDGSTWLTLWDEEPNRSSAKFNVGKHKRRIPRGDILFIVDVKQEHIDHIILHVIHDETVGYVSLSGELAFQPTKYFKRL